LALPEAILIPLQQAAGVTNDQLRAKHIQEWMAKHPAHALGMLVWLDDSRLLDQDALVTSYGDAYASAIKASPSYFWWALLALGGAAAAAGGGGGDGDGGAVTPCGGGACDPITPDSNFVTAEYLRQPGLSSINVIPAYSYGATGAGVLVSVFDSGILASHSEFADRIDSRGYDFVLNRVGVSVDGTGHGTHVSGIIAASKNDVGMHGVAYEATLLPYRIFDSSGVFAPTDSELASAIQQAGQWGSRLFNQSWGTSALVGSLNRPQINAYRARASTTEFKNSVSGGAVHVWSAGNEGATQVSVEAGLPHYETSLQAGWVAVMALDHTGVRASYSNACGLAAAWCLAAPGGSNSSNTPGIESTWNDGAYAMRAGTSMAAPHVTGALALLKSRFPNLSMQQVRDRVLLTADKSGVYADQTIYGQGLLDVGAAASPVGLTLVPMSSDVQSDVQPTQTTSITVPQSLLASLPITHVLVVDSYQRAPFQRDLTSFVHLRDPVARFDAAHLFDAFEAQGVKVAAPAARPSVRSWRWDGGASEALKNPRWSLHGGFGQHSGLAQAIHLPLGAPLSSRKPMVAGRYQWPSADGQAGWSLAAWTPISQDDAQTEPPSFLVERNPAMASSESGWALQQHWQWSRQHRMQWGVMRGQSAGVSDAWSGTGAFNTGRADSWTAAWGGDSSWVEDGGSRWDLSYGLHHTQLRASPNAGLWQVHDSVALLDTHVRLRFAQAHQKTAWSLAWGQTRAQGSNRATLRLPQSVNEAGEVSFRDFQVSLNPLYDQSRWSLSLHHAMRAGLSVVGVISHVAPEQGRSERLVGAALRWGF
jgi:subtilisin family serine protease